MSVRALAFITLVACAATPPLLTTEDRAVVWRALQRDGDIASASRSFEQWREAGHVDGVVGAMVVAAIASDMVTLRSLTESLASEDLSDPELLIRAALAAAQLRPIVPAVELLVRRTCQHVDNPALDEALRIDAQEACSFAGVLEASPAVDTCSSGCDEAHTFSMLFAGNAPVVMANVAGSAPAPFIVDTGASANVVTREFAEQHGIQPVPGTLYQVGSPGGLLEVSRALVDIRVGGLAVQRALAIIVDLPIEFVGGIISPQAAWRGLVTEFDFQSMELHVTASPRDFPVAHTLALHMTERTPYLRAAIAGRSALPFVLDTGATTTTIFSSWAALPGPTIERSHETTVRGAGHGSARAWAISQELAARTGELEWRIASAVLAERGDGETSHGAVRYWGLLGMDLMMGRRVQLDLPASTLRMSSAAALPAWPVGASATYRIQSSDWEEPVVLVERVLERERGDGGNQVLIDVSYTGHAHGHLRYRMADTWQTRGAWLISRPASEMWTVEDDGALTPIPADAFANHWLPVFTPFQTVAGETTIRFVAESGASEASCTEISVPAQSAAGEGRLTLVECPTERWRTRQLTLLSGDQTVYEFRIE
ncbi:MAG: retroviral-like aspartic protease family protein [Myxococcota bacterium]